MSDTIQDMLETEMDNHLGYDRYERSGEPNYRNGTKPKTVRSKHGEFEVNVPQDRQSSFELQVFPKCCAKQEKLFLSVLLGST